jgi:serine/threonine protein kinase
VFTRSAGDVRLQRGLRTEKLSGIVIEWMSGGDLWELLRKEKLRSADLRSPSCGIARDEFMQAHGGGPGSRRQSPSPGRGDRRGERRSPSPRGKSQAQWNGPRQRRSTLFSLRRQLTIFRQIFEALVYLHEREQPLIHRDLKSANILVRYDLGGEDPVPSDCFHDALDRVAVLANRGSEAELAATASAAAEREVRLSSARAPQPHDAALSAAEVAGTEGWHAKLTDFGLSRTAGLAEYVAMTCCGSPAWTAPEVFRGGQVRSSFLLFAFYSFVYSSIRFVCSSAADSGTRRRSTCAFPRPRRLPTPALALSARAAPCAPCTA